MVVSARRGRLYRRSRSRRRRGRKEQRRQGRRRRRSLRLPAVPFLPPSHLLLPLLLPLPVSARGLLRPRLPRRRRRRCGALHRVLRGIPAAGARPRPEGPAVGASGDARRAAAREDQEAVGVGQVALPGRGAVVRGVRGVHEPVAGQGGAGGAVDERQSDGGGRRSRVKKREN